MPQRLNCHLVVLLHTPSVKLAGGGGDDDDGDGDVDGEGLGEGDGDDPDPAAPDPEAPCGRMHQRSVRTLSQ